jgi:hypothetical protein
MGFGGIVKFDREDALRILDFLSTFTITCNDSSILSRRTAERPVFSKLLEAKRIAQKESRSPVSVETSEVDSSFRDAIFVG